MGKTKRPLSAPSGHLPRGGRISASEAQTRALGVALGRGLKAGSVVCLFGPLGSGKTQFVQGVAAGLGCKARVTSPTFTLVREYKGRRYTLYHLDLYRIGAKDLRLVGWEDYLSDPKGVCAIEWPERAEAGLPEARIDVEIEPLGGDRRRIRILHKK